MVPYNLPVFIASNLPCQEERVLIMNRISFFILLMLTILLFTGCSKSDVSTISITSLDNLWGINETSGFIEPIEAEMLRTIRVNDLIIQNLSSLIIGGLENGTAVSRIGVQGTFLPTVNKTRFAIVTDNDLFVNSGISRNGTTFMSNFNRDFSPNSNAFVSPSDPEGNGIALVKWNRNHEQPFLSQVASLFGNIEIITTHGNNFSNNGSGNNRINIGFYDNLTVSEQFDVTAFINREFSISINSTQILMIDPVKIDDTLYFNATFDSSPLTSPPLINGSFAMFGRNDQNIYVKRPNGQIKRIQLVGTGSSVFSEIVKLNNHTYFYGNIYLNNSVYNGGGVGYACIDAIGRLFKSSSPCHTTSTTYTQGSIADPTMGDE